MKLAIHQDYPCDTSIVHTSYT